MERAETYQLIASDLCFLDNAVFTSVIDYAVEVRRFRIHVALL